MSLFHSRLQKRFRWARMYVLTSFFERTFCLGGRRRPTVPPRLGRRGPAVSLPTRRRPPPFFSSGLRRTCFSPVAFKMFLVTTVLERFDHGVVSPRAPVLGSCWALGSLGLRLSRFWTRFAHVLGGAFRPRPRSAGGAGRAREVAALAPRRASSVRPGASVSAAPSRRLFFCSV